MKKSPMVISLVVLLCFSFCCKEGEEVAEKVEIDPLLNEDMAADVIKNTFELKETDNLEIVEISLESQESALVNFELNGNKVSSKIKKAEADWKISEILNIAKKWTPADNYLLVKGKLIHEKEEFIANREIYLHEAIEEEGKLKTIIRELVLVDGMLTSMTPRAKTDSQGNFTVIADRRYWEKSGVFIIGIRDLSDNKDLSDMTYVRGPDKNFVTFTVDKNVRRIELGDIELK